MKKTAILIAATMCSVWAAWLAWPTPKATMQYLKQVKHGDTLWGICANLAANNDDVREIVYRAMKENNIKNPTEIQPGTVLIITVPKH